MNATAIFGAGHIETGGAEEENIGAAVGIFLEWVIGFGKEIHNIAAATSEFSEEIVTPEDEPNYATDE